MKNVGGLVFRAIPGSHLKRASGPPYLRGPQGQGTVCSSGPDTAGPFPLLSAVAGNWEQKGLSAHPLPLHPSPISRHHHLCSVSLSGLLHSFCPCDSYSWCLSCSRQATEHSTCWVGGGPRRRAEGSTSPWRGRVQPHHTHPPPRQGSV